MKQSISRLIGLTLLAILIMELVLVSGCATPQSREKFTEFYILGAEGRATDYPEKLKVGEEGIVTVVIINREQGETSYRLRVMIDGVNVNESANIGLEAGDKWENKISFISEKAGQNQKVEFLLYKNGESEVYLDLHLWIDVEVP